jgi:hypothetical protein
LLLQLHSADGLQQSTINPKSNTNAFRNDDKNTTNDRPGEDAAADAAATILPTNCCINQPSSYYEQF